MSHEVWNLTDVYITQRLNVVRALHVAWSHALHVAWSHGQLLLCLCPAPLTGSIISESNIHPMMCCSHLITMVITFNFRGHRLKLASIIVRGKTLLIPWLHKVARRFLDLAIFTQAFK